LLLFHYGSRRELVSQRFVSVGRSVRTQASGGDRAQSVGQWALFGEWLRGALGEASRFRDRSPGRGNWLQAQSQRRARLLPVVDPRTRRGRRASPGQGVARKRMYATRMKPIRETPAECCAPGRRGLHRPVLSTRTGPLVATIMGTTGVNGKSRVLAVGASGRTARRFERLDCGVLATGRVVRVSKASLATVAATEHRGIRRSLLPRAFAAPHGG
jgi:hypothetical protein